MSNSRGSMGNVESVLKAPIESVSLSEAINVLFIESLLWTRQCKVGTGIS